MVMFYYRDNIHIITIFTIFTFLFLNPNKIKKKKELLLILRNFFQKKKKGIKS